MKANLRTTLTVALPAAALVAGHVLDRVRGSLLANAAVDQLNDNSTAFARAQLTADAAGFAAAWVLPLALAVAVALWAPEIRAWWRNRSAPSHGLVTIWEKDVRK